MAPHQDFVRPLRRSRAGEPSPLKTEAEDAYNENKDSNQSLKSLDSLLREVWNEQVDNARWMADFTLKWLELGLRLREATKGDTG